MCEAIRKMREKSENEGIAIGTEKGRAEGIIVGRAEGIALGIEQGKAEEQAAIRANLHEMGFSDEAIQQILRTKTK